MFNFRIFYLFNIFIGVHISVSSAALLASGLVNKKYEELSDQFQSQFSKKAFSFYSQKNEWSHAESKYFIFHYASKIQMLKAYKEANFYLKIISQDCQLSRIPKGKKFNIWLFKSDSDWNTFCLNAGIGFVGGFAPHNGREFLANFSHLGRKGSGLFAHELTHVVLRRKHKKTIPIWFNEGFAEYEADQAYARYKKVQVRADYRKTGNESVIELSSLVGYKKYPSNEYGRNSRSIFYTHSEILTRLLIGKYGLKKFNLLGNALVGGMPFKLAVKEVLKINNLAKIEKEYIRLAKKHVR